jgi:hypothetical protein
MPKFTLRLTIALLTFAVGIVATAFWLTRRAPKAEKLETPSCQWTFSNDKSLQRTATNESYFPAGTFYSDEKIDEMFSGSRSQSLAAMGEPVLYLLTDTPIEVYRFGWFRSFRPGVVIRLWRIGNERCLSVKQFDGLGDYVGNEYVYPKTLAVNQTRSLTESEWNGFVELLHKADFWQMLREEGATGTDGSTWVMEGLRNRHYHAVERWYPRKGYYREAGIYLIKLSGIKVDESRNELY